MAVLNTTSPEDSPAPVKDRPHKVKPSSNASNAFKDYLEVLWFSFKYTIARSRGLLFLQPDHRSRNRSRVRRAPFVGGRQHGWHQRLDMYQNILAISIRCSWQKNRLHLTPVARRLRWNQGFTLGSHKREFSIRDSGASYRGFSDGSVEHCSQRRSLWYHAGKVKIRFLDVAGVSELYQRFAAAGKGKT